MEITDKTVVLGPRKSNTSTLRDLWRFRELFIFLAWRDILLRYKQAFFGVGWALFRPALTMLLLTLVFNRVAKIQADPVPYSVFVLAGMLVWQFFAGCASDSSVSLISNSSIVTKVYFPRLIVPASATLVNLLDFGIGLILLAGLMFYWKMPLNHSLLLLPLWILLLWVLSMGVGFWLSSATVLYRDVRFVVPFFLQIGLYASPVGYSTSSIPAQFKSLIYLNPVSGIIDGFRGCLFGTWPENIALSAGSSLAISLVIFVSGLGFFKKLERSFADVI